VNLGDIEVTDVERLALRPGEVLVIHLGHEPDQYTAHRVAEHMTSIVGEKVRVLVLGPGSRLEALDPAAVS